MTVLRRRFKICHSSNKLVGLSHKTDISIFLADKFEYIGILYGKIRSMASQVYRQHIWCQLPCITRTRNSVKQNIQIRRCKKSLIYS